MRRCSDGLIISQKHAPGNVRKVQPPPILPPEHSTNEPEHRQRMTGLVGHVGDWINRTTSGVQPQHLAGVGGVAAVTAAYVNESTESGESEESEDDESSEEERDFTEEIEEEALVALWRVEHNVKKLGSKKLLKKEFKKFKRGVSKVTKKVAAGVGDMKEEAQDAQDMIQDFVNDPTAAMMEGLDALQSADFGEVASGAADAVAARAAAASAAAGAVTEAASSAVGKAAKQMQDAHKKHYSKFKENLARATAKAKQDLQDAHADTVRTITDQVSDARNVAEQTSKTASKTSKMLQSDVEKAKTSSMFDKQAEKESTT